MGKAAKQSTAEDVFDELLVEVLPFMFTSAVREAALMLGRAHMAKARAALTGPQFVADQIMNGYVEQEVRFAVQDAINEQISEYFTSRAADAIVAEVVSDLGFEVCQTALIEVEAARARDEIVFSEIVSWIR